MINSKPLLPAVIVIKPISTAKADIETACRQVAQITTEAVHNGIVIIDIVIIFQGAKDIAKRVKSLTEHKEIKALLIYNAKQLFCTKEECNEFIADMTDFYGIKVINYR